MSVNCPCCSKVFKTKQQQQKHYKVCSVLSYDPRDEMSNGITINRLFDMVTIMAKNQKKMKLRIQKLERKSKKIKHNVNLLEILNERVESEDYWEWIKNLEISKEGLDNVIVNGFQVGITDILTQAIYNENSPFKAFNEMPNRIAIFTNKETKWKELTDDMMKSICNMLVPKLLFKFMEIEKNIFADEDGSKDTEKFGQIRRILYGNGKISKHAKIVKRKLYNNLKMPASSIYSTKYT